MADVDHARIKRNISKMVDQGAPESDIDAYVSSEGVTPAQLRAAPSVNGTLVGAIPQDPKARFTPSQQAEYEDKKRSTGSQYPYVSRFLDSGIFGAGPAITSAYEAARDTIRGPEYLSSDEQGSFSDHYTRHLKVNKATREDIHAQTDGVSGFATDLAGGVASGGPGAIRSVLGAGRSVVMNPIQTAKNLGAGARDVFMGVEGARAAAASGTASAVGHGAAYGAVQGGFSGAGPNTFDLSDAGEGGVHGGAIGFGIGRLPVVSAIGARNRLARAETIAAERSARLQDMTDAGVAPLGIAAGGDTARATAGGLARLPGGAPIRDAARASITDLDAATQRALLDASGGRGAPVLGEDVQTLLRRNLTERTFRPGETAGMTAQELERTTGPVGETGYGPLRTEVPPVRPRDVQPLDPAQFREQVAPRPVAPIEPQPRYTPLEDIGHGPEFIQKHTDLTAAQQRIAQTHDSVLIKDWKKAASTHDADLTRAANEAYDRIASEVDYIHPTSALGNRETYIAKLKARLANGEPVIGNEIPASVQNSGKVLDQARARIDDAVKRYADIGDRIAENQIAMHDDRMRRYQEAFQAEDVRARQEADRRTEAAHQDEVRRATGESEARAQQRAQDQTAADRARAQQDAEAIRAQRQREADADYQRRVDDGETFRVGRTRERTYPDEFDAAYERTAREMPRVPVALLGRKAGQGTDGRPGVRLDTQTATSRLLHEIVNEEARTLRFPRQDSVFVSGPREGPGAVTGHGGFTDEAASTIRARFGDDIADTLIQMGQRRAGDLTPPSVDSIRNLRTQVFKEEAALARARRIGETRNTDEAALKRLRGAITHDLHATLADHGPRGVRASRMLAETDAGYAEYMGQMRKPLSRLFGENVSPGQAMDRITEAATNPDRMNPALVRNFMRVVSEKGTPNLGTSAILMHMAGGSRNMRAFLDGYRELPPTIRNELFRGDDGRALRDNLDRLARVSRMVAPFERVAGAPTGTDLTSFMGAAYALNYHFWPTFAASIGTAAASRFMASPRYVAWLTQVPVALQASGRNSDRAIPGLVARLGAGTEQDHHLGQAATRALVSALENMTKPKTSGQDNNGKPTRNQPTAASP